MWKFLTSRTVSPLVLAAAVLVAAVVGAGITARRMAAKPAIAGTSRPSPRELYRRAVVDAMVIKDGELFPLVEIAPGAPLCSWKDGKVLMATWHKYPASYVPGTETTLAHGEVWTFTEKEMARRFREAKAEGVTDWELRLSQLIGVPPEGGYTHFTAMWVKPGDIVRPGYAWRLEDAVGRDGFAAEPHDDYKTWFHGNIVRSYFTSAYPWTRLGYTYDWSGDGKKYGLSEFLIRKGAVVEVEFTMTTEEFIGWLERQAVPRSLDGRRENALTRDPSPRGR